MAPPTTRRYALHADYRLALSTFFADVPDIVHKLRLTDYTVAGEPIVIPPVMLQRAIRGTGLLTLREWLAVEEAACVYDQCLRAGRIPFIAPHPSDCGRLPADAVPEVLSNIAARMAVESPDPDAPDF